MIFQSRLLITWEKIVNLNVKKEWIKVIFLNGGLKKYITWKMLYYFKN